MSRSNQGQPDEANKAVIQLGHMVDRMIGAHPESPGDPIAEKADPRAMQTGPRGGRYYLDDKGRKVYGEPDGTGGGAKDEDEHARQRYDLAGTDTFVDQFKAAVDGDLSVHPGPMGGKVVALRDGGFVVAQPSAPGKTGVLALKPGAEEWTKVGTFAGTDVPGHLLASAIENAGAKAKAGRPEPKQPPKAEPAAPEPPAKPTPKPGKLTTAQGGGAPAKEPAKAPSARPPIPEPSQTRVKTADDGNSVRTVPQFARDVPWQQQSAHAHRMAARAHEAGAGTGHALDVKDNHVVIELGKGTAAERAKAEQDLTTIANSKDTGETFGKGISQLQMARVQANPKWSAVDMNMHWGVTNVNDNTDVAAEAETHRIAALIEQETLAAGGNWAISVESNPMILNRTTLSTQIRLELVDDTPEERQLATEVLNRVAAEAKAAAGGKGAEKPKEAAPAKGGDQQSEAKLLTGWKAGSDAALDKWMNVEHAGSKDPEKLMTYAQDSARLIADDAMGLAQAAEDIMLAAEDGKVSRDKAVDAIEKITMRGKRHGEALEAHSEDLARGYSAIVSKRTWNPAASKLYDETHQALDVGNKALARIQKAAASVSSQPNAGPARPRGPLHSATRWPARPSGRR